jgi:histone H1/5
VSRDAQPQAAVALFGKKAPAAPKKAAVKPMLGKPKAKPAAKKPVAKKPVAKKPVAKKPVAKKTAAKAKPLFSFGTAKKAAPKSATASKSKYTITKTAGTVKKSKPTSFKTVNIGAKKPAAKPMGVRPMGGAKASAPRAPKPAVYDRETVGTAGVASIFAGTFLLTLAALPAATEAALEVIGIGYSGYFLYNWVANPESRGEFDKTLTKIDDETGINLKKVASVTGDLVSDASKALAASAEKSAEASAAAKAAKAKEVKAEAKKEVAAASDAKKTFKEAVKEAVKDADK